MKSLAKFSSAWRHFPLALVLGCSLYALGFWIFAPMGPLPWHEAASMIRQAYRAGDAITTRPWWAARAREDLGDLKFIQVRDLEHEDLSLYKRLWVISLPGHHGLFGPFADGTYKRINHVMLDGLDLSLFKLPPPVTVAYDFRKNLRQASVSVLQKNTAKPCSRWVENKWLCTNHPWNYVGQMIVELRDDPREVIWAHPSDQGLLQIKFHDVPGGKTLMVHTGLTPPAARTPNGAPVHLDVEIDSRAFGTIIQANETGYFPHPMDISALGPGPHKVTFKVHADNIGMRHFCFQAQVYR